MAINCSEAPSIDYFPAQKRPQNSVTTFSWDDISYNDSAIVSDSCDSTLPSPISPDPLSYPPTAYTLPTQDQNQEGESRFNSNIKSEQTFNFGTFDDWMAWDDPSDAALSPISEEYFPTFISKAESPSLSRSTSRLEAVRNDFRGQRPELEDESAVFGEVAMNDEPLFQTSDSFMSPPLTEMLNREGLYSTPLSWTPPTIGVREQQQYGNRLSPEEEEVLRNIAMPPGSRSQAISQAQYPTSPSTTPSSPRSSKPRTRTNTKTRKRKSVPQNHSDPQTEPEPDVDSDEDDRSPSPTHDSHAPVKKTAHNMIEKRYRTNLNDKIAALRDSVPALRVMSKKSSSSSRGRERDVLEDLQGLTPAHKLNKATILSKATEYISHLEKRNHTLSKENLALKARVDAFEILMLSRQAAISLNLPLPVPQSQSQSLSRSQQSFIGGSSSVGGREGEGEGRRRGGYEQQQQRRDGNQQQQQQVTSRQQYLMDGMMGPI